METDASALSFEELKKVRPTLFDMWNILEDASKIDDRSMAIVCGDLLQRCLQTHLDNRNLKHKATTFNSLIQAAKKTLGTEIINEIDQIRKIRNAFSHCPYSASFEWTAFKSAAQKLRFIDTEVLFSAFNVTEKFRDTGEYANAGPIKGPSGHDEPIGLCFLGNNYHVVFNFNAGNLDIPRDRYVASCAHIIYCLIADPYVDKY